MVPTLVRAAAEGLRLKLRAQALVACALLVPVFGNTAHAVPILFEIDSVDVQVTNVTGQCGLFGQISGACIPTVNTSVPISFSLDGIGDLEMFDLFSVNIGGFGTGSGTADLLTTLTFSSPSTASSGSIGGMGTFESTLGFFRFNESASISFTGGPSLISFDDGTEISLELAGGADSCSAFLGCELNVGVSAITTLQTVPEPGTLALFGAGLFGLGFLRVRRNS